MLLIEKNMTFTGRIWSINFSYFKCDFCLKLQKGIVTKATQSVPSPVMNLQEVNPHVTVDKLMTAVGWEFLRSTAISAEDGGKSFASKQRGFQLINPTNDWFPGTYPQSYLLSRSWSNDRAHIGSFPFA